MRHQRFMGLLFVMASSALYGISPLVVTSLVECGVHYSSVMFFKGGIAAIELLALACASRQRLRLSRDESVSLVLAGLLHAATSFFLYGSYERLATGLATALHFTYPLFVALFCFLLFRDRINLRGMVGVCMATAGTAFFIWNSAASQTSMTGLLMAVASAIVYALYLIVMKKFPAANVSSAVFALYEMACSAMFSWHQQRADGASARPADGKGLAACRAGSDHAGGMRDPHKSRNEPDQRAGGVHPLRAGANRQSRCGRAHPA